MSQVETLLRQKTEGPDKVGFHPETGEPIYILIGPYGPYVQLGDKSETNPKPKQASLPKGVTPEALTLEIAVGLLALPRLLGLHPETGKKIQASLGRFGPYVVHDQGKDGKDYRSLKKDDDVLSITLERALELLAEPKVGRGGRKTAKPLRELGLHPADQEPVNLHDGPYGPYVKHGKTNISLPEGQTVDSITLELAVDLLATKAPKSKATGRKANSGKTATKSSTTTKQPTTKTAAKKTTAKKSTTKRSSTAKTSPK
jgi:DNA topoisomerase-1